MIHLTMSSFSNDIVRSYLNGAQSTELTLGPGGFRVTIKRVSPGKVWITILLNSSDEFSFAPVVTDELTVTLNQSSQECFFWISTSIENNLAFIDMMTATLNCLGEGARAEALSEMKIVLSSYLEFFAQRRNLILSQKSQRGLLCELLVLEELFAQINDSSRAIATWQGPLGKPQDFIFRSPFAVEVKSRMGLENTVVISNEQQLDASQLDSIFLCVFPVKESPSGISLQAMVKKCLSYCDDFSAHAFYLKLGKLGLEKWTLPYHENYRVSFGQPEIYRIQSQSKVITPQSIPTNTSNVQYKLHLAALDSAKMKLKTLISKIANDE
jgi:hypothetical protein